MADPPKPLDYWLQTQKDSFLEEAKARVLLGAKTSKPAVLSNPFILLRPFNVLWDTVTNEVIEEGNRVYGVKVGCLAAGKIIGYRIEGQALIGSRDGPGTLVCTKDNHARHFPGAPFPSEVRLGLGQQLTTIDVHHIPILRQDGTFAHEINVIKMQTEVYQLTLDLQLQDRDQPQSERTELILRSVQEPGDLPGICELVLNAELATHAAFRRARTEADALIAMLPKTQTKTITVASGDFDRIAYDLRAVGLRMDQQGMLYAQLGWGAADEWRWYAHRRIWNDVQTGAGTRATWTATDVRDEMLNAARTRFFKKPGPVLPFEVFIGELRRFENANSDSLERRIELLRRAGHERPLIFDQVIGTPEGPEEEYQAGDLGGPLQFLKDHNRVIIWGKEFDLWHLMVGLDALPRQNAMPAADRRVKQLVVEQKAGSSLVTIELPTDMERVAAATWAGDIGSALGDWMVRVDEKERSRPDSADDRRAKLDYYWKQRASDADLDGDVIAWGIIKERAALPRNLHRVSDLLLHYFRSGNPEERRRTAFREFVRHYEDPAQSGQLDIPRVRAELVAFASIWQLHRLSESKVEDNKGLTDSERDDLLKKPRYELPDYEQAADELTSKFLIYVQDNLA